MTAIVARVVSWAAGIVLDALLWLMPIEEE
jgi:hypothetical protein